MVCPYCSREIQDSVAVCNQCGANLNDTVQSNSTPYNLIQNVDLPMKWYKFLIYFLLLLNALTHLADGIFCLIGNNSGILSELLSETDLFTGEYRVIDIVYGIICILMSGAAIYVRSKLANYKEDAPRIYIIYDIISSGIYFVYSLLSMIILENAETSSVIGEVIGTVVGESLFVYLNIIYFKKRKHLFINK